MTETKVKKTKTEKNNNKFAVIEIAGTQLKIEEGKEYEIRNIEGKKGDKVEASNVLLISEDEKTILGNPFIKDAKVILKITSQGKGEKIDGFKYNAKARYRKHFGVRPLITKVLVEKI